MKRVTIVELMNGNEVIGHAPVIMEKGKKPVMFVEDGKALSFDTPKEARAYGKEHIIEEQPVFSKEDMIKICGDLTWSAYKDKHFIIRNQIKDTEPYYNSSSLHISEDRYIIDGERYRTMWAIGGNDYDIEKLTDSTNCLHKNTHKNVCYDCDKEIADGRT